MLRWVGISPVSDGRWKFGRTLYLPVVDAVDLGGSLVVASKGLWSTGVSTDLNGTWRPLEGGRMLGRRNTDAYLMSWHIQSHI